MSTPLNDLVTSNVFSFLRALAGDEAGQAAAPGAAQPTYQDFVAQLRQPQAADVVQAIKAFVYKLLRETPEEFAEDPWERDDARPGDYEPFAGQLKSFAGELENRLARHPLWRACSRADWTNALEGAEKFVLHKVYPRVFAPTRAHRSRDERLAGKLARLAFVTPEQLDVRAELALFGSVWLVAGEQLKKMDEFRSPRDKLVCVMNCCRLIGDVLSNQQSGSGSADDFLPILLYVVLQSNPTHLHSNVEFIAGYRAPNLLTSEQAYFLTQLASAVQFFYKADHSSFGLSQEEFASLQAALPARDAPASARPPPPGRALELWTQARFRFAQVKPEDLRVQEAALLLEEYKLLVEACRGLVEDRDGLLAAAVPPPDLAPQSLEE